MKTVVLGAGAAGLWSALYSADRGPVVLVAPHSSIQSATAWAQGGIAAATQESDSPAAHAADTMEAGAGLCDPEAVRILTDEAPLIIKELSARGMVFDNQGEPTLEGGHGARRVLHAGGDASGRELLRLIDSHVAQDPRITRVNDRAGALVVEDGAIRGVELIGSKETLEADRVIIATGGACGIYGRRTGPDVALGGGMRLAFEAGAALADLEFVQFHPTALDMPDQPARLFTEALRGEGAHLVDINGNRFMDRFDTREELAPRDKVARAVVRVRRETGARVFLDARHISGVKERFPVAAAQCAEVGLDLSRDLVPVAPAAHYFTGGILTDVWGRTPVSGLLACGEAACTGVHGANRLASNSLTEALVFGRRAGLAPDGPMDEMRKPERDPANSEPPDGAMDLSVIRSVADDLMGVERSAEGLSEARALYGKSVPGDHGRRPVAIPWLVAAAALRREESRGGHFRSDFPVPRQSWLVRQAVDKHGWAEIPVSEDKA